MTKNLMAKNFDEKYVTKEAIIAAGGKWSDDDTAYVFPDGSWGRFTDIRNNSQESRLRFIASNSVIA